jgi:hypothetical protein
VLRHRLVQLSGRHTHGHGGCRTQATVTPEHRLGKRIDRDRPDEWR